jgi:SAM-dependent methyltransferase
VSPRRRRASRALKRRLDRLFLDPADRLRQLFTSGPRLPPPSLRRWVGAGDFLAEGRWFVAELRRRGALADGTRCLDLGCGCGRLALPLAADAGLAIPLYRGFDVDARCIAWCLRHIGRRHPAFGFYRADLRSSSYNPRGGHDPARYRFPHDAGSFDLLVAASLFTHLLPPAAERFLAESGRVLRAGGALYLTAFLLSPEADPDRHAVTFEEKVSPASPRWRAHDARFPEAAVALDEAWFLARAEAAGLELDGAVAYGMQDHLLLRRR